MDGDDLFGGESNDVFTASYLENANFAHAAQTSNRAKVMLSLVSASLIVPAASLFLNSAWLSGAGYLLVVLVTLPLKVLLGSECRKIEAQTFNPPSASMLRAGVWLWRIAIFVGLACATEFAIGVS